MKNNNEITWAIIPARSGSKGFKDKNIYSFLGHPLIAHSILFAKKLSFIDKVVVSTDSDIYADIAKKYGAEVPFLRSEMASDDVSMEEHVLDDIFKQCKINEIEPPTNIVWLRPTHPLRSIDSFNDAKKIFDQSSYSVCVVTQEDPRVFSASKDGFLIPLVKNFKDKSMIRRQDIDPFYRIFHGEFFKFPSKFNIKFLGDKIRYVVQSRYTVVDIDDLSDLEYSENLINKNIKKYEEFIHTD